MSTADHSSAVADDTFERELRFLMVEDVPEDAELIENELRRGGFKFKAHCVETEQEFLAELQEWDPDVVISDYSMPRFSGLEALKLLNERRDDVPFILVTGALSEEIAVECIKQGADDYVVKSSLRRLPTAVRNELRKKAIEKERQRIQEALRESEARFRLIAENMRDLVCLHEQDGRFRYVSPSVRDVLGYDPEELDSRSFADIVHPDDERIPDRLFTPKHSPPDGCRHELRVRRKGGDHIWLETIVQTLKDEDGVSSGFQTVSRDVTERKLYESQLIEAKEEAEELARLKSAFLANMSHEIRTPLTSIIGFSQVLAEEASGEQKAYAESIGRSGERLLETLNSILTLATMESRHPKARPVKLNLETVVREAVDMLMPLAERKNLSLSAVAEGTGLWVKIEPPRLYRILNNIVGNAVKFTEDGGITVTLTGDESHVYIRVRDTGIGIDESFLPHVFDEFRQESAGMFRTHEGSGLGLTITKKLVEESGGEISAQSRKGAGSTFVIKLPRAEAPTLEKAAHDGEQSSEATRPLKILIVEDSLEAQQLFARWLSGKHDYRMAADAESAVDEALRSSFDVILIDINLGPSRSGIDILSLLRETDKYRDTPIIALTAFGLPGDRERFLASGFDDYVSKPLTKKQFFAKIRSVTVE